MRQRGCAVLLVGKRSYLRFRSETGDRTIVDHQWWISIRLKGKWLLEGKEGFSAYKGEVVWINRLLQSPWNPVMDFFPSFVCPWLN